MTGVETANWLVDFFRILGDNLGSIFIGVIALWLITSAFRSLFKG
jgi:hypothetical protein